MEIVTLYSGRKVIRGGAEVFADSAGMLKKVLETGRLPKELKPEKLSKAATQRPRPRTMAKLPVTSAKPRLEVPTKQKQVAKPKPETVEELKAGDWLKGLQSLTTKGKEREATEQ